MIPIPKNIKLRIPGYRTLWKQRSQCLLDHLVIHAPLLSFNDDSGLLYLQDNETGRRFYGFPNDPKSEDLYSLINRYVPSIVPKSHFRLIKDYINRYLYPHMRPDMDVTGYTINQMAGFHAQHKDSIQNLPPEIHKSLTEAFRPAPDDIIINCGAFIGFGDIRVAETLTDGMIIAVEASLPCFEFLSKNLHINHVKNVMPIHRAAWNEISTMELESDFAQANSLVEEVLMGSHRQKVKTTTIDQIMEDFSLPKLDMISLTLNGAEIEALDGAKNTLSNHRPRIRLAGWYSRNGIKISTLTKKTLKKYGYQVFVGPRNNVMALGQ